MANASELMPFIHKWEGGYSNHKNDKGGCTMKGVTINTFRSFFGEEKTCSDLKSITDEQWLKIFKEGYWDPCKGDKILDQSVANIIVDWAWMSGVKTAIKKIQELLNLETDGIVGPVTLTAINSQNGEELFNNIYNIRKKFYYNRCEVNPSQEVFLDGWLNRLNDLEYV